MGGMRGGMPMRGGPGMDRGGMINPQASRNPSAGGCFCIVMVALFCMPTGMGRGGERGGFPPRGGPRGGMGWNGPPGGNVQKRAGDWECPNS